MQIASGCQSICLSFSASHFHIARTQLGNAMRVLCAHHGANYREAVSLVLVVSPNKEGEADIPGLSDKGDV